MRGRPIKRTLRRQDLVDSHRIETRPKLVAVGLVAVVQQKPLGRVPRERVADERLDDARDAGPTRVHAADFSTASRAESRIDATGARCRA